MKVLIVGDKPSKHNTDPDKAFVGSRCYPRLMEWLRRTGIKDYELINSDTVDQLLIAMLWEGPVITLGVKAHNRLLHVKHASLPHPSGLNRKINDRLWLAEELSSIKLYVDNYPAFDWRHS